MTYDEAIQAWLLDEPQPEDFDAERKCFEDDLTELRDDRDLKLECLRLAVSIQAAAATTGYHPENPVEAAREFFEFVTA